MSQLPANPTPEGTASPMQSKMLTAKHKFGGHEGRIYSFVFLHDNVHVVSGSLDDTMRKWDCETGRLIGEPWKAGGRGILGLALSPDGKTVACGRVDGSVQRWDTDGNMIESIWTGHSGWVWSLSWSPRGGHIASGSNDGIILIREAESGKVEVGPIKTNQDWVQSLAYSPLGDRIASGGRNCTICIWDSNTGNLLVSPIKDLGCVESVVWSLDGSKLYSASDRFARAFDSVSGTLLHRFDHDYFLASVALSPKHNVLACVGYYGVAQLWDTESHKPLGQPFHQEDRKALYCVSFSRDGLYLAYGGDNNTITLWTVQAIAPQLTVHAPMSKITQEGTQPEPPSSSFVNSNPPLAPEAMLKDLVGSITKIGNYPIARGGFGEIWKCTHETNLGTIMVAVKSLLLYTSDEVGEAMEKKVKRIRRELRICLRLKHPNILPVHGYTSGFGPFMAIVCPWADNGNLTTYLEREDMNLTIVKRFQILRDIAAGLQYLHTNNVIHGDLTGPNVLIHGDGTACLADFGLSLLYSDIVSISQASWTSAFHGNFRWLAPELLGEPEDNLPVRPNTYSDIYSFGGIMLQVLTNKVPYYYLSEAAVTRSIYTGVKPSRSRYPVFSDKYWHFIDECWSAVAQERPSAQRVVEVINNEFDTLSSSM